MNSMLTRPRRRPELNLVPLIDVLVMLIFFSFVTMQFRSATTLNITLPKIDSAGKNEFKNGVTLAIEKDGAIFFNGKPVTDEELNAALVQVHNTDPDTQIVIKGDENSQLKRLAFLMDACQKNGLPKFTLQSRE
jgi:biopolymer transport protein ExbD